MILSNTPSLAPSSAPALPRGLLRPVLVLGLALLLANLSRAAESAAPAPVSETNCAAVPVGWLQLPGHELVLDFRSENLAPSCRQNAGEFLLSILNQLLQAGYTVRLSDGFLLDEIDYYRLHQEQEKPAAMVQGIVACLRQARAAQVLDWSCFKAVALTNGDMLASGRHLPWMSPPVRSDAVGLVGAGGTNLPQLRLRLHWTGLRARSAVQYAPRRAIPGENALLMGHTTLWSFSAALRLQHGGQVLLEKDYPQEPWEQASGIGADLPLERAIQRILQDLDTGLKPKPEPPAQPKSKKPRKSKTDKAAGSA